MSERLRRMVCALLWHRWGPAWPMVNTGLPGDWRYRVCRRCGRDWAYPIAEPLAVDGAQ